MPSAQPQLAQARDPFCFVSRPACTSIGHAKAWIGPIFCFTAGQFVEITLIERTRNPFGGRRRRPFRCGTDRNLALVDQTQHCKQTRFLPRSPCRVF